MASAAATAQITPECTDQMRQAREYDAGVRDCDAALFRGRPRARTFMNVADRIVAGDLPTLRRQHPDRAQRPMPLPPHPRPDREHILVLPPQRGPSTLQGADARPDVQHLGLGTIQLDERENPPLLQFGEIAKADVEPAEVGYPGYPARSCRSWRKVANIAARRDQTGVTPATCFRPTARPHPAPDWPRRAGFRLRWRIASATNVSAGPT